MKIALVIDHLDPRRGGAEQWTFQHAERLLARGHEVHVVAQGVNGPAARLDIVPHLLGPIRSVLQRAAAAAAMLERLNVDMVHDIGLGWHSHVLQSEDGSRLAQWEQKLLLLPAWQRPWKRAMLRVLPRYRDFRRLMARQFGDPQRIVIAVSQMCARDYQHYHDVPAERIRLVYHGTDNERFSPAHRDRWREEVRDRLGVCEDEVLLLFVGHDYQRKGLATAVRAANRLAAEGAPVRLVVVGGKAARRGIRFPASPVDRRWRRGDQCRRDRRSGPLLRRRRRLRAAHVLRSVQPERFRSGGQRTAERDDAFQRRGGIAHRGRRRQRDLRSGRRCGTGRRPPPAPGSGRPAADGRSGAEAGLETYAWTATATRSCRSTSRSPDRSSAQRIGAVREYHANLLIHQHGACRNWADRKSSSTPWPGSFSPWDTSRWCWPPGADRRAPSTRPPCPIRWPGIRGSSPRTGASSWYGRWMAKLHRTWGFDVIHCHGTYPAGYVGACCKAVRHLPLVITSHGDDLAPLGLYDRKPELRQRYRMALEQADAAVAISDYTAGMFREACPQLRRIVPIPNGVEVEQFAAPVPRPANLAASIRPKSYLLFLGRLDPRKGIDVLLGGDGLAPRPMRSRSGRGRPRAGRAGPGSPLRTAGACRPGSFRRPNGRPGRNSGCCKTAFA